MIKDLLKEAFILKKNGYYKHAIEIFYKALEIENNSDELFFEIADSYFQMKDIERALNYIEQILEHNPTHLESLRLLKKIFIEKEAWSEAEQTAKNIYYISKNGNDLVEILNFLNKQERYHDVLSNYNDVEQKEILYEKAFAEFHLKNFVSAQNFIQKALDADSENCKYLLLLGNIYLQKNEDDLALEILNKIEIKNNYEILTFAGLVNQRFGEYKKAINYFLQALKCEKHEDISYYNCASTYFKLGDTDNAKKYYNLAILKNPENNAYHLALANLYYAENNYKRAYEELNFNTYEARLLKSIILFDTGYYALAKKEFEKLALESPEDEMIKLYTSKIEEKFK